MTTTVTVKCHSCQASYQAPRERAGAHFKCKKCGETLTVPKAPEESAPPPARPVVMPAAGPAARPVVKPVVMPVAEPVDKPVVMPSRPPRPQRGRAAPEPAAKEPTKSRTTLVLAVLGGVVLLGAGGYFAFGGSKDADKKPKAPENANVTAKTNDTASKPVVLAYDAAKRIKELTAATGSDSAGQMWALAQKIDEEWKSWQTKGAPAEAADRLCEARDEVLDKLVGLMPDHAEARAMRGEVRYDNQLDPFFDAAYLSESERDLVRANRLVVNTRAGENAGWITKLAFDTKVKPLVEKFGPMQAEAESRNASPFGKAAKKMENDVIADMNTKLGGKAAFRAFIHHPYLIFVEENASWSPSAEAKTLFSPLKGIHEAFLREFGGLNLKQLDDPVPVLYFKSEEQYQEYNKAIGNTGLRAAAHYEPQTGRLALNRGVNHEVIIHEGTHQLFDKYTSKMLPHPAQSFWFQEGIAEWFGGSNRLQAKDGSWTYETGVLLDGRLGEWRALEEAEFKLPDLLDQTYGKRNDYIMKGGEGQKKIGLVYAQGWFLIYFLNHFNVDDKGVVQIGSKGKYRDRWNDYLKAELSGKTGKKVFMECLKVDEAGLEKMHDEYKKYFLFVVKKQNLGHVKDKKLVKWDEYVNKKGQKTGEKDDDLLIDPRNAKK
jgi:hypothetical protein